MCDILLILCVIDVWCYDYRYGWLFVISAVSWLYSTISPYISVWMCAVVCGAALIDSVIVDHWQTIVSVTFLTLIAVLLITVIGMCYLTHIVHKWAIKKLKHRQQIGCIVVFVDEHKCCAGALLGTSSSVAWMFNHWQKCRDKFPWLIFALHHFESV